MTKMKRCKPSKLKQWATHIETRKQLQCMTSTPATRARQGPQPILHENGSKCLSMFATNPSTTLFLLNASQLVCTTFAPKAYPDAMACRNKHTILFGGKWAPGPPLEELD